MSRHKSFLTHMYKYIYSKMLRIVAGSFSELFTTAAVCFFCAFICCIMVVSLGVKGQMLSEQHFRNNMWTLFHSCPLDKHQDACRYTPFTVSVPPHSRVSSQ